LRLELLQRRRGGVASPIRPAAAIAPAQSSWSTIATATGRCFSLVEGKTASAAAAALETGSEPPIRVVLLVAKLG
jgi:hypothetical protein